MPAAAEKPLQKAIGWAARDASGVLSPFSFTRRGNGETDITVKILYCGICHTDLHYAKNEHGFSVYPLVPGHEIVGEVAEVGSSVQNFKPGDKVGVGAYVSSCRACEQCEQDLESYCPKVVHTISETDHDGSITRGGYSDKIVVDEHYAVRIPDELSLAAAAPLLCAGITVYSPLRYYGLDKPGLHVGVVGLGGLGHIAVKFCKALGARVTVISTSPEKKEEAVEKLGADGFLISRDEEQMKEARESMDGIIDTVSAKHPLAPLVGLLKTHGKLVLLGAPSELAELPVIPLLVGRRVVGGSNTGGMKETQEMMDFAAKHDVVADVEVVAMDYVNEALERLERGDVKYRFVIDVVNTLKA